MTDNAPWHISSSGLRPDELKRLRTNKVHHQNVTDVKKNNITFIIIIHMKSLQLPGQSKHKIHVSNYTHEHDEVTPASWPQ